MALANHSACSTRLGPCNLWMGLHLVWVGLPTRSGMGCANFDQPCAVALSFVCPRHFDKSPFRPTPFEEILCGAHHPSCTPQHILPAAISDDARCLAMFQPPPPPPISRFFSKTPASAGKTTTFGQISGTTCARRRAVFGHPRGSRMRCHTQQLTSEDRTWGNKSRQARVSTKFHPRRNQRPWNDDLCRLNP